MPKLVEAKEISSKKNRGRKKQYEYSSAEKAELKKLGRGILLAILRSGNSLEKFAYSNELAKGNLSKITKGTANLRYTTLRAIAKGLGFKSVSSFLAEVL